VASTSIRLWIRIVAGVFAVLLALWLGTIGLILLAGRPPELQKADAILVLGAAQYNGKPSPVFRARLDHAIKLYHQDYAPYLILTGGVGVGDTLSEGEVGRRYALQNGVTTDAILVERQGVTSFESVSAAAELMKEHNLHKALLVSDPYHMLRLQLLARRAGIEPLRAPRPQGSNDLANSRRWHYVLRESVLFPATAFLGAFR
jgi:uncharacterized SAM-binding protein YcdF (DUF218 family)